jgi:tRNA pseudouridine38-40 synthase
LSRLGLSVGDKEAAPSGPLRRVMLLVAYDGSEFHGFAAQAAPGIETVGGRLAAALGRMCGHQVAVTCAGRTDSGVHASGQVVHADLSEEFIGSLPDLVSLTRSLNRQLGPALAVLDTRIAPEGFDARRCASGRRYRYQLLVGRTPDPLLRHTSWHRPPPLELGAMRIAADTLVGEHDFSAFCRRPPGYDGPLTRRVTRAGFAIGPDARLWTFEIEANAFCHRMVRSIVGTIVSVGEGRLSAADMMAILRSGDRARGGRLAPAGGLSLVCVTYPEAFVAGGVWRAPL